MSNEANWKQSPAFSHFEEFILVDTNRGDCETARHSQSCIVPKNLVLTGDINPIPSQYAFLLQTITFESYIF